MEYLLQKKQTLNSLTERELDLSKQTNPCNLEIGQGDLLNRLEPIFLDKKIEEEQKFLGVEEEKKDHQQQVDYLTKF